MSFQLLNLRDGFAANSSSTHSFLFYKKPVHDDVVDTFGWDFFTAASKKAKQRYLAEVLYYNLRSRCGKDIATLTTETMTDVKREVLGKDDFSWSGYNGYIDHQSAPCMPKDWEGKGINLAFFNEYKNYVLQDHLIICGGNDNTNEKHPLPGQHFSLPLFFDENSEIVARKDNTYHFWTLFDRTYGRKMRVRFGENMKGDVQVEKSEAPELVDIKITDFCSENCEFCYQASTVKGRHADHYKIRELLINLSEAGVFEIALGGGEPTHHPEFKQILQTANLEHLVVNFTTKSLKWLQNDKQRNSWLPLIGSFAFSANTEAEVLPLIDIINTVAMHNKRPSIQCVMGVITQTEFVKLYKLCAEQRLHLIMLGFKNTGRGLKIQPLDDSWWFDEVSKLRDQGVYCKLGTDTAFIAQYKDLIAKNFPSWLYTEHEGRFSCYIDMVSGKMAPCSYSPKTDYLPLVDNFSNWLTNYATF